MNLNKLRGKMAENRLTQKKLAGKMGLSERSVNRMLTKRKPFNNNEILQLKKILNLTNEEILEIFINE
ncbi:toxin-antitoxin system, antitoxin component, Xre family [Leptotrichia trevisanii]|uniref:DUF739 family protein n=1 Tax=Leptotrichia trevisanii TaxID=109328 RepID=UPI00118C8F32|nr:DUF739 family protein [Leptotrichia trevisanii]BBM56484.1 toxin-antitoxin system, antitoxin component, Xre family [Leptotrichia trevisanii]